MVTLGLDLPNWKHDNLISYQADLTDTEQTNETAQLISSSHKINNIVHNAGMILPNLLPKVKTDDILTLSHLHLAAPIALTQAILPNMINDKNGRIVFISSRASMGMPTRSAYAATKAGIHGLAKTWALELAENNDPKAVDLMMDWAHGPAGHFGGHPVPGLYHINTGGMLAKSRTIKDTLGVDFRACDNYKNGFEAAKKIKIPTLSILATGDKMCPVKEGRKLADLIDGSKVDIIDNCGHMMLLEEADRVLKVLKEFIVTNYPAN